MVGRGSSDGRQVTAVRRALSRARRLPARQLTAGVPQKSLRSAAVVGAIVGVLLSCALVWGASEAVFTARTYQPNSSFTAGTVTIADDDGGGAWFSTTGKKPGDTGSMCIEVTYNGNITSNVKMYQTATTGTGTAYVQIQVDVGTGGEYGDCTGFSVLESSSAVTMASFAASYSTYAAGFGTWAPTGSGQSRTYRITYVVLDDDNGMNKSAGLTLRWEAKTT